MANLILRGHATDRKLLDYALQVIASSDGWWQDGMPGTTFSRRDQFQEYRLRMEGRRSVAGLYRDAKDEPFEQSSNVGVPAEQIFSEFLIPTLLANTHDLEPMLQAIDLKTEAVDEALTAFHDRYHRVELSTKRQLLEESTREVLTVGSVFHKWTWGSLWKQREVSFTVFTHPLSSQPIMRQNPQTGQSEPWFVDPKMPDDLWPVDPATGIRLTVQSMPATDFDLVREGPQLTVVTAESILFPPSANTVDPESWDYAGHRYAVSPWWFLGREGDPFDGKLQNLPLLWKWLGVKPDEVHRRPDGTLTKPVRLAELQMKFPVDASGKPVEVIALVAEEAKLLLAWRVSKFPRRNLFARQVFSRGQHPLGKGIPETAYGLRSALDASVNQDIDAGNLYNHPPLLLSSLAMLEDEDYETTGPGTQWVMTDINGAKFLPPPIGKRDPIARENWLLSMLQRMWGVTDLNLNAPTDSLAPSLNTARGTMAVLNQGSIKFGHLTKRLSETDTLEYQFGHDLFSEMLANSKTVSIKGQPVTIKPEQRQTFFRPDVYLVSRGNGVTTNPALRQQVLMQGYPLLMSSPFIGGDLSVRKDYEEQLLAALGIQLDLKDPQALQQSQLVFQLLQTPEGQAVLPQALQAVMQQLQLRPSSNGKGPGPASAPSRPNVALAQ